MESIPDRTFKFGVQVVRFCARLPKNSVGWAVSHQIVRSGTSIGANVEESQNAPTRKDFVRGMTIALKEARETYYWFRLIKESELVNENFNSLMNENNEIIRILISSVKKAKNSL